jgi:iron-sulfur cluster assembly protein
MLTLTPNAEQAVRKLVADSPISEEEGGLRIAPGQPTPDGVPLELSIVGSPEPDDQDAGAPDAHVYLEPTAAEALDDKVLDAEVEGNSIGFALLDGPGPPPPSDNGTGPIV